MRTLQASIQISNGKLILPLKDLSLIDNLNQLKELVAQELEDLEDIVDAENARNEPTVKWKDVKKRLNAKHGIIQ